MEIKLDSLINENRGEIRINISVKNHPDELWRRFASVDMPRLIPHNGRAGHKCQILCANATPVTLKLPIWYWGNVSNPVFVGV